MMNLLLSDIKDPSGVYGSLLHYSLVLALIGSTLLVFIYLWRKGRLDLDEEPKHQMMKESEEPHE
jgi:hypothetical protein